MPTKYLYYPAMYERVCVCVLWIVLEAKHSSWAHKYEIREKIVNMEILLCLFILFLLLLFKICYTIDPCPLFLFSLNETCIFVGTQIANLWPFLDCTNSISVMCNKRIFYTKILKIQILLYVFFFQIYSLKSQATLFII